MRLWHVVPRAEIACQGNSHRRAAFGTHCRPSRRARCPTVSTRSRKRQSS